MKTYHSFSSADTKAFAAEAAATAGKRRVKTGAAVIALHGDLGAGKTTFVQGFLHALGARGRITSPTFVLMKKFPLASRNAAGLKYAYHIDAYRFRSADEAGALGLRDIFNDPQAIVLVEWPERIARLLPRTKKSIRFLHGKKENERVIKVL